MDTEGTIKQKIKEIIVSSLNLDIFPENISDDIQLFGQGLALDSLDALDLAVALEMEFGTPMNGSKDIYKNTNSLCQHISQLMN